jgi:hypothetical protein
MTTPLPLITALARAGALEQASRLFEEGGYFQAHDNPAALAVKGRSPFGMPAASGALCLLRPLLPMPPPMRLIRSRIC